MKNQYGWDEIEQELVSVYKRTIFPHFNDAELFPKFVDEENDRTKLKDKTHFQFGKRKWFGIPNAFATCGVHNRSLPHFSFRFIKDKNENIIKDKFRTWMVISGKPTIERFLNMNQEEKSKFINLCKSLPSDFNAIVWKKIYKGKGPQSPDYEEEFSVEPLNSMKGDILKEVLGKIEYIYENTENIVIGKEARPAFEISCSKKLDENELPKALEDMKDIFILVSNVKTQKELQKKRS